MEVQDAIWFGYLGCNTFGIIKAKDTLTNNINFYIGAGQGLSEKEDIHNIMAYGTKYTQEQFIEFFKRFLEVE